MAKHHDTWTVLAHGPIEELEDNLWRVEGTIPGMALRRVMTVIRLSGDRLAIHSAVCLDDAGMARLEQFGTPAFLLVPSGYHRMDALPYKQRFPGLTVLCPPPHRKRVSEVCPVDGDTSALPADENLSVENVRGTGDSEAVLVVHSGEHASLVFNDLVFNMPDAAGLVGFVLKHVTGSTGGPKVSRVAKMLAVKNAAEVKAHLLELADTPGLRRIVVSHHRVIDEAPADVLRSVAQAL